MGNTADTGNDPAALELLPSEGAENSSDPAPLPAAEQAIDAEINEGAREAADEPIPEPKIPLHPLAAIVPMRDDTSIRELARQIAGDVPLDPIILFEDQVLDRWELYLACLEAGREPPFETYTGKDPFGFLIARQLQRGLLNESQRGMLGARVCNFPVGGNQYYEGLSIGRASELLNVSPETISRAKKVLARGIPELVKAVDDGLLKVGKAYTIAKKQPQQQREELERLFAAASPVGRTSAVEKQNPPKGADDTSQFQVEAIVADADGSVAPQLPAAGPQGGDQTQVASTWTAPSGAPSGGSAAERSSPIPRYGKDQWIWPGYIPSPGVTAIVGSIKAATSLVAMKVAATVASGSAWPNGTYADDRKVIWLTAQRGTTSTTMAPRDRLAAAGAAYDRLAGRFKSVRIVEPELDGFGLPIHHFCRDLRRLEPEVSATDKVTVVVIDYFYPYVGEDVEQTLHDFRGAFSALKDFAAKFGIAVILPCRLPCGGRNSVITRAIDALSGAPEVDSVLVVEGTNRGTVVPKKTWTSPDANAVAFRTCTKPGLFDSASVIVWENSIATKSPARHLYTTGSLSNREIANTSNPDVSHESSSPGAVPAASSELAATPSVPSATSATVELDLTELAAATGTNIQQSIRPGASANVGKPVLALNKPLARKPTVPVTPLRPQPAPGASRPFSSVAADEADKEERRPAKSAFGGKRSVGRRQDAPTKPSAKPRKLGKRKVQEKKGKRLSRDDLSDWW